MVEAFAEEERRQDDVKNQRTAWQTAHLMNATGNYKKKIKPTDLYIPVDEQENKKSEMPQQNIVKKFNSKDAKKEYLEKLQKKFNTDSSQ